MKQHVCMKLILLIFATGLVPAAYPAFAQEVITLRYAHFMPSPTAQAINSDQWCKEVEKRPTGK